MRVRSQLQQSEATREVEMADIEAVTSEFTLRLSQSEKTLQAALRVRSHTQTFCSAATNHNTILRGYRPSEEAINFKNWTK